MSKQLPSNLPPFQTFTPREVEAICAAGTKRDCEPGEMLFQTGERGESMYVIDSGSVELIFVEGEPGKILHAGDIFGELAFITGSNRRTASAQALEPSRLWEVDQAAVDRLFEERPRLLLHLLRRTCGYLLASESRLIESLRRRNRELQQTLDYLRRTQEEVDTQELLANTDQLTGLYNRRCFDKQLSRFVARASDTGHDLALILLDLDGFKPINDTHGHPTGDRVLKRVADIITNCVRSSDLPCRYGGDEFAVILPEAGLDQAQQRAEEVRHGIQAMTAVVPGCQLPLTASIGGALLHPDETPEELLERTDKVLYQAKQRGRNQVIWCRE